MSEEENKAIARRYYAEIMNRGDLAVIDELMAPDFIFSIPTHPETYHGPDGFKNLVTMLRGAFPDVHLAVMHLLAQGDTVVGHWIGSGNHTGGPLHTTVGDIPPTGKSFIIDGMTWLRMADGKIVESRGNEDTLGLLQQLGVVPGPPVPGQAPSPEEVRGLVNRYFDEILNQGKLEVIAEIMDSNFALRIPTLPLPVMGPAGMEQFVKSIHTGFPDIHFTVERQIIDGDRAASRWTITGTHLGPFLGIAPSGNKVQDQGVDIFRVANGKLVELWVNENDFGLLTQMGAMKSVGQVEKQFREEYVKQV